MAKFVSMALSATLLLLLFPAAVSAAIDTSPDQTLPWPGSEANHSSYWDDYFGKPGACVKVDEGGDYITINGGFRRLVIKNDQRNFIWVNPEAGAYASDKGVSHYFLCDWDKDKKKKVLNFGGRILGPCGDPYYTARAWNGKRSTRAVTIILEVRGGKTLWKRTLQPGQSVQPRAQWLPGGKVLILRRGNGTVIDRERTVTGTFPWTECRA